MLQILDMTESVLFSGVVGRNVVIAAGVDFELNSSSGSVWAFNLDTEMWQQDVKNNLTSPHNARYSFWLTYNVLIKV